MILSAVGYVALALFGSKALPFIAIRAAINLVGCPSTCVMSALCNDIGDNIEMQGKEAPRAFLQGLAGATTRVGLILSSSISAFSICFASSETLISSSIFATDSLGSWNISFICFIVSICLRRTSFKNSL